MTNWAELYRPRLGKTLVSLVWMPITADTSHLVSELATPSFSFSGAVHLRFEGAAAIDLTWNWKGDRYTLATIEQRAWQPHALDRIQMSLQPPWSDLHRAVLTAAECFALSDDPERNVVGVRHETSGGQFWIGTGGSDFIGDFDDLWVGVDCDPPNLAELVSVGRVESSFA